MMKKMTKILLVMFMLFFITACSSFSDVYTTTYYGKEYEVNLKDGIITDGSYSYHFVLEGGTVNIVYPDNSTYWWVFRENGGSGGYSDDYDPAHYVDGQVLVTILEEHAREEPSKNILLSLLFIIIGLWQAINPKKAWYFSYGWHYKNAEASDNSIMVIRVLGIVGILVGLFILFL